VIYEQNNTRSETWHTPSDIRQYTEKQLRFQTENFRSLCLIGFGFTRMEPPTVSSISISLFAVFCVRFTNCIEQFGPSLRFGWKQLFCYRKEFQGKGRSDWGVSVLRENFRVQGDEHPSFDQRPILGFHPLPMQWWYQIYSWGRHYRQSQISYVNSSRWIDLFLREPH